MKPSFRQKLDRLNSEITFGVCYFRVWHSIFVPDPIEPKESIDDRDDAFSFYQGFFTPIENALRQMMLLQFAKVYDHKEQTASLRVLLSEAQSKPELVPHAAMGDLKAIAQELEGSEEILKSLKLTRDQRIVHVMANPCEPSRIEMPGFEELIDRTKRAFNSLAYAHDRMKTAWGILVEDTDRHSKQVLQVIQSNLVAQRAERQRQLEEARASR
jgi:hypothetical protein